MHRYAWVSTCWLTTAFIGVVGCGGGVEESVDATVATIEPVRGEVRIGTANASRLARIGANGEVAPAAGALARLTLDGGGKLILDGGARVIVPGIDALELQDGRIWADAQPGDAFTIKTTAGTLRVGDASVSITLANGRVTAYVVRGEVSYAAGNARGTAHAGEEVTLGAGAPATRAATLWSDWTGGLARPGPVTDEGAAGVGVLEARVPDELGLARWPLVVRRLDVKVTVQDDLAITEVDQIFFNPASETVEGLYRIRVPEDAVLQRFAVDRNGRVVDGYVREKQQARAAYEAQVYRGSTDDPALLEWDAPGAYRARIYPIAAGETRRIVIRYAEWLSRASADSPRLYRYPMGGGARAPYVQEFSLAVDLTQGNVKSVRAGMGATVEDGAVLLRRSDFRPRADFWLELVDKHPATRLHAFRAEHTPPERAPGSRAITNEADERDYFFLPIVLPESLAATGPQAAGLDLVLVADVSAATDRAHLELGRSVIESLAAHLGASDRIAIVTSDLTIRPLGGEDRPTLGPASPARVEGLLDGLARVRSGGATDLGAAITAAAGLLDPARRGAVVYVGDGAPTVGELGADELLETLGRLPAPLRFYAVAVGADANLELLQALSHGGGLAMRAEERADAGDVALRLLAHAARPLAQRVTVDLGTGVDNVFPRRPVDVVVGEALSVVGRIRRDVPTKVTVRGVINGRAFTEHLDVETKPTDANADLRLRWAGERLRQLLLEGAGREAVAELGTRYGLITPFTSFYVPSARELGQTAAREDADRLRRFGSLAMLPIVGPTLLLSGCQLTSGDPPPTETSDSVAVSTPTASGTPSSPRPVEVSARVSDQAVAGEEAPDDNDRTRARHFAQEQPEQPTTVVPAPIVPSVSPAAPPPAGASAPQPTPSPGMNGEMGALGRFGGGSGGGNTRPTTTTDALEGLRVGAGAAADPMPQGQHTIGWGPQPDTGGSPGTTEPEPRVYERRPTRGASTREGSELENQTGAHAEYDDRGEDDANRNERTPIGGGDGSGYGRGGGQGQLVRNTHRGGDFGLDVRIRIVTSDHKVQHCSDAARQSLDDRRALWNERLGRASGVSGWVDVYRRASRDCELPGWRDRRALLDLLLAQAGSVATMVQLYHYLDDGSARGYLRGAILRRVRTPGDLRLVRQAFGLGAAVDWALVERLIAAATTPAARVRVLRRLLEQFPDSFDLKLRLLSELESLRRVAEARRLADQMRADPLADAGVRTAIGEMFLRLGDEAEARRVFSEIVEFAPYDELARRRLGDLYRAHGWFEDAYRQYETLATIRPDDPTVSLLLAQAAAGAGRIDEALRLEQRLAETAEPGASQGAARTAILWSSVRFAKLRQAAREQNNAERVRALLGRMRRSGVLREAGAMRVSLTWSHPDAGLSLWSGYPGLGLTRPSDIAPEFGIEAFDVRESQPGRYRVEVRRAGRDLRTSVTAELVIVWNEGQADEKVQIVPLTFDATRRAFAWTIDERTLATATTSVPATEPAPTATANNNTPATAAGGAR